MLVVDWDFLYYSSCIFDREKFGVVGKGRDNHAVAFVDESVCHSLEPAPGTGNDPGLVHVEPFREFFVELGDTGPRDLVKTERLAAEVTGTVPIAVRDKCLACLGRQPSCRLDGVDVDVLFLAGTDIEGSCDLRYLRCPGAGLEIGDDAFELGDLLSERGLLCNS